ncbi:hypothetical protein [Halorubrum sp. 2020YC2]|uniref:DUF5789 family protein n=1 Tax=Halorubrum sp. 2020YC2 TaxID=2836432 RepID=UPI001BE931E5|nr:hypothetical protein [Halorubrum sp. 2020YC2]QWC19651.1 hypothetical protein KI388_01340 [Halorubrum sp. 2020YC2]
MEYSDTERVVEQSLEFPVTRDAVIEQIGTVEIESPSGDFVTIREVLDPVDEEGYLSSDALYATIVGNLDETFIGRKYYDDRGSVPLGTGADDDPDLSF